MSRQLLRLGGAKDAPAVFADGKWSSYGDLERRAARIVDLLGGLGIMAGDHFAFFLPNSVTALCCYLACARSGLVGVPISQRASASELAFQLTDSRARALLYGEDFEAIVQASFADSECVRHILAESRIDDAGVTPVGWTKDLGAEHVLGDASPFCVIYTGGTTGASKAAVQTRGAWACCLESSVENWRLTSRDRHLIALPMSHAAWFTAGAALQAGGTVNVLRAWDPDMALDLVERHEITTMNMIPTMLGDLIQAFEAKPRKIGSLRLLTVAGSVLPLPVYERACAAFGEIVGNIYGLTEAAGPVTFLSPEEARSGKLASVGKPGRHIELAILDEAQQPTAGSEPGEIGLAGPQITPGYLGRPEETRKSFAGKWFLTGDIGRLDEEGFLYIVDRSKDMIKTGGFNVYPSEVEQILHEHDGVLECAVLGMPDMRWTEAVHAVVALAPGVSLTERELVAYCKSRMPGFKAPKRIHFVARLPRTRFGKFDKAQLKQDLGVGAADAAQP